MEIYGNTWKIADEWYRCIVYSWDSEKDEINDIPMMSPKPGGFRSPGASQQGRIGMTIMV